MRRKDGRPHAGKRTVRPEVGGQYAYLREAFHPSVAFLYGWALLLVIQTGGMAAVAVTFARYFVESTRIPISDSVVAALVLAILTGINCLGVRAGSTVQSFLMVLKILAILALIICGLFLAAPNWRQTSTQHRLLLQSFQRRGRRNGAGVVCIRRLADGEFCCG